MLQLDGGTNALRTLTPVNALERINAVLTKDAACSDHFIVLSPSVSITYTFAPDDAMIKFGW